MSTCHSQGRLSTVWLLVIQLFLASSTIATTSRRLSPTPGLLLQGKRLSIVELSPLLDSPLLSVRGGALLEDYDDEDEDYDDDELFGLDDADFDVADDDFAEENRFNRIMEAWKKTPPLTKSYLTASFVATAIGYLTNKNHEFPKLLMLEWSPILTKLQLWRPLTAFLNFGPFGLGYLLTTHFVWTYMSTLERLNHDRPYDFWIMIMFGCITMEAGYAMLNLSPRFLGHNLSTFLVYIWSRYHEGLEVSMFELFNTRAETLPWFFLAQTFLFEGELPVLDFLGIVFGHVYHHCKTTGMLRAPQFVVDWYESDSPFSNMIRNKYKTISSDFELQ